MKFRVDSQLIIGLRGNKGWTQEQLADAANMHGRTIQRVENEGFATGQTLAAIAGALEVEPESLRQYAENASEDEGLQAHLYAEKLEREASQLEYRRITRELVREAERLDRWEGFRWPGLAVMAIGGVLIVNVLLQTQASFGLGTPSLTLFFAGITIGLGLMCFGAWGAGLADKASKERRVLARKSPSHFGD